MGRALHKKKLLLHCLEGLLRFEDRFDTVNPENAQWIIERLRWHKIMPLAAALSDPARPKCPALENAFLAVSLNNRIRERQYFRQASGIFRLFREASIDFLPYKGPFWAQGLYPDYSWIHIGDIDLLLSKENALAASSMLKRLGYVPDVVGSSEQEDFIVRGELTYFPPPEASIRKAPVQLHWELLPSHRFAKIGFILPDDFFRNATPAEWKGLSYLVPPPEVRLFYYILHATCQHQFKRFVLIVTMAHFINKFPLLDWDAIYQLAESRHSLVPLYYGLKFIHRFSPLPAPAVKIMNHLVPAARGLFATSFLTPCGTLRADDRRGKLRRKLFRLAMSRTR